MLLSIRVTAEHLQRGAAGRSFACPIALALREEGMENPIVGRMVVFFHHPAQKQDFRCELPIEVMARIAAFDLDIPIKPFEFELEARISQVYRPVPRECATPMRKVKFRWRSEEKEEGV